MASRIGSAITLLVRDPEDKLDLSSISGPTVFWRDRRAVHGALGLLSASFGLSVAAVSFGFLSGLKPLNGSKSLSGLEMGKS